MKLSEINHYRNKKAKLNKEDRKTLSYCLAVGFIAMILGTFIILMTGR